MLSSFYGNIRNVKMQANYFGNCYGLVIVRHDRLSRVCMCDLFYIKIILHNVIIK